MRPALTLEKYYAKRKAAIGDILRGNSGRASEKDYHDLRVDIKKLKALMELLNYSARHFKKKLHSNLLPGFSARLALCVSSSLRSPH